MNSTAPANAQNKRMRAIVFSNFPKDTFENSLRPKFEALGIEVGKLVKPDRADGFADIRDFDFVVAMVELMSTGQKEKIKQLAKRSGKKYVPLNRQGATWRRDFGLEEEEMANTKSVPDDLLDSMLRDFMKLVDSDSPLDQVVVSLRKYWKGRPLNTVEQMMSYMQRFRMSGRCPEYFTTWWSERQGNPRRKFSTELRVVPPESIVAPVALEPEPVSEPIPAPLPESIPNIEPELVDDQTVIRDLREEIQLYKDYHDEQTREIQVKNAQISDLKKSVETLTIKLTAMETHVAGSNVKAAALQSTIDSQKEEIAGLKSRSPRVTDDVYELIQACKTLMRLGQMPSDEALEKIFNFTPSKTTKV